MTGDAALARMLARQKVPLLRGARNALLAAKHVLSFRDFQSRPYVKAPEVPELPDIWRMRLRSQRHLPEWQGLSLLKTYGLNVPEVARFDNVDKLIAACDLLRFPIALKVAKAHAHKSDAGGVDFNIISKEQAVKVYENLAARLGPKAIAIEMAPSGHELALGAIWDESFGSVVILSAGGVLIEYFDDRVAALAPFDRQDAARLIAALLISDVLQGVRGRAAVNLDVVAEQVSKFSLLAASLGNLVAEIDVNPLISSPKGAFAVDCLVVPTAAYHSK
ncbi:MAG: acetate--CoA ligase family protein [Pseudomonadota bacterium]